MSGLDPTDLANTATAPTETSSPPAPTHTLAAGTLLANRYRIVRVLGRGGMGVVYAARDTVEDRDVAVKLVAGRRSEDERERLRDELRTTIELTHPNIARTYTLELADGELFIVMELLVGHTLAENIAAHRHTVTEAVAITTSLLDALGAAHAHKLVHRDVKPSNIMICESGRVVLMDFGLARSDDAAGGTHTTSIKGTPAYMAPEVVSGRRADARADLYAVGLILFELLTGEPPFRAATATELFHKHLHDPIETRRLGALAPVVARLTAKDPAARYGSVDEVRAALAAAPQHRRRARSLRALAIIAVLLGGGGVVAIALRSSGHVSGRDAPDRPKLEGEAKRLFEDGQTRFDLGEYAQAAERFRAALAISPSADVAWDAAEAYRKANRLDEARWYYQQFLSLERSPGRRADGQRRLDELAPLPPPPH